MLAGFFVQMANFQKYNDAIEVQALKLQADMKQRAASESIRHRKDSPSSGSSVAKLKAKLRQRDGVINRIGYQFPRALIYTHTGSGKGQGGLLGSRWQNKYGQTMRTNPRSLGKAGTGNRKEKPFIDRALIGPEGVGKISEIAAVELGAVVTGNLFVDKNNIGKK